MVAEQVSNDSAKKEVVEFNFGYNSLGHVLGDKVKKGLVDNTQTLSFEESELITVTIEQDFRSYDKDQERAIQNKPIEGGPDWVIIDHDG